MSVMSNNYYFLSLKVCSCRWILLIEPLFLSVFTFFQKAFHADIASVMRKWLKEEELLPEGQRLTSQAKAHYVKVSVHTLCSLF